MSENREPQIMLYFMTSVLILEILKCGGSSPPCPKNVGAWSIKMGTFTSAKEGLILEASVCPYVCYAPVPRKD